MGLEKKEAAKVQQARTAGQTRSDCDAVTHQGNPRAAVCCPSVRTVKQAVFHPPSPQRSDSACISGRQLGGKRWCRLLRKDKKEGVGRGVCCRRVGGYTGNKVQISSSGGFSGLQVRSVTSAFLPRRRVNTSNLLCAVTRTAASPSSDQMCVSQRQLRERTVYHYVPPRTGWA